MYNDEQKDEHRRQMNEAADAMLASGADPDIVGKITRGMELMNHSYDDECRQFGGTISDRTLEGMSLCIEATIDKALVTAKGNEEFAAMLIQGLPPMPTSLLFHQKLLAELLMRRAAMKMQDVNDLTL